MALPNFSSNSIVYSKNVVARTGLRAPEGEVLQDVVLVVRTSLEAPKDVLLTALVVTAWV